MSRIDSARPSFLTRIAEYLRDFFDLFFPNLCAACGTSLVSQERVICTKCIFELPRTRFHLDPENILAKQFWGRVKLEQASAFVHFQKGSKVQHIMHELKYKNRPEAAARMGELYAQDLKTSDHWIRPDVIIPVPLHASRFRRRGYNQSEEIAKGLASVLKIPIDTKSLVRITNTSSQTRKNRFERYENLLSAFALKKPAVLASRHILLVDDVVTTGATLEACCVELMKVKGVKVSICAMAYAE